MNNKTFLVLSNTGCVEYKGNNEKYANERCADMNAQFQSTSTFYKVVEQTKYRLLVPLAAAAAVNTFPYQMVYDDMAAWYMDSHEYARQMYNSNMVWLIKTETVYLEAVFDEGWYEECCS